MSDYSQAIVDNIRDFLESDGWNYRFEEDKGLFRFGLNLKAKINKINYVIHVKEDEFCVYAVYPLGVDPEDQEIMTVMTEFICRANYGLRNGNLELDVRDGEIRYKSFVDCDGQLPSQEVIQNSIYCPAAMCRRYASGVVGVIYGGMTAEDAVNMCEQ